MDRYLSILGLLGRQAKLLLRSFQIASLKSPGTRKLAGTLIKE